MKQFSLLLLQPITYLSIGSTFETLFEKVHNIKLGHKFPAPEFLDAINMKEYVKNMTEYEENMSKI